MKKYLAVFFSVIFLLSFAVTAFAIHEEMPSPVDQPVIAKGPAQISLGGRIITRGWYFNDVVGNNVSDGGGSPVDSGSQALYTTNVYLTLDVKVSDNLRAFMELETSSGESNNSGVYYWGTYDTKNDQEMKFRQVWMQYTGSGLLGMPAGIKVGHMPIILGEKIFLNNERFGDDAILVWIDPMKELHLVAGTAKLQESSNRSIGSIDHTQDLDGYVVLATYQWNKDNTAGVNWTWAHSDGNIPSLMTTPFEANTSTLNFHNFGIHGNGKIAGFTYAAEADFQVGQAKDVFAAEDFGFDPNLHFKGWGVYAKLGYALDMFNLRASFAMGSGDDGNDPSSVKEFQTMQGTDATGAIARLTHYTLIYEKLVRTAAAEALLTTQKNGNVRTTGIANTTYYNIGIDATPLKELSISLDGYLLEATRVGKWENVMQSNVSKTVGTEVDMKLNYKITKNFSYFVEAGVFFPGNFYTDTAEAFLDDPGGKKTVTSAVHGLSLAF